MGAAFRDEVGHIPASAHQGAAASRAVEGAGQASQVSEGGEAHASSEEGAQAFRVSVHTEGEAGPGTAPGDPNLAWPPAEQTAPVAVGPVASGTRASAAHRAA